MICHKILANLSIPSYEKSDAVAVIYKCKLGPQWPSSGVAEPGVLPNNCSESLLIKLSLV